MSPVFLWTTLICLPVIIADMLMPNQTGQFIRHSIAIILGASIGWTFAALDFRREQRKRELRLRWVDGPWSPHDLAANANQLSHDAKHVERAYGADADNSIPPHEWQG
jgi:hypothetical protein